MSEKLKDSDSPKRKVKNMSEWERQMLDPQEDIEQAN